MLLLLLLLLLPLLLLLRCLLAEWRRWTRGRQQGEARDLPARIAQPLYILLAATTYYHADLSTESERKPTLRTALHILPAHWIAPHTGLPRTHLAWKGFTPTTFSGAREGVLVAVAAVKTRRRLARTSERVRGAGTGLEPSLGYGRSRIPAMASSQGDVRPSPMAYPAVRPLPKLPLPLRPDTGPTS